MKKIIFFFVFINLIFWGISFSSCAQTVFNTYGSACQNCTFPNASVPAGCYRLTNINTPSGISSCPSNPNNSANNFCTLGQIWSSTCLNLSQPFTLNTTMYFGTEGGSYWGPGADGMCFVLKATGAPITTAQNGGMLGYSNPTNPTNNSIAVEFDTYDNGSGSPQADPADPMSAGNDHVSIFKNGSLSHGSANELTSPVFVGQLENGAPHNVIFAWNPTTTNFSVTIDGNLTLSANINLSTIINSGSAYFGWTAGTGWIGNVHWVCPNYTGITTLPAETVSICSSSSITLDATTVGPNITWTPSAGLSSSTGTVVTANQSGTYTARYTDACGLVTEKQFNVQISQPTVTIANISICEDGDWTLTPSGGNYDDLSWDVTVGDAASDPVATGTTFSGTGGATISVTPMITGCTSPGTPITVTVTENSITPFSAGNDVIYCVTNLGDNYTYANSNITVPAGFPRTWATYDGTIVSTQPNGTLVVNQTGHYVLSTTGGTGCTAQDTVLITLVTTPVVTISGNINHCVGTTQTLSITGTFSTITWNAGTANFATNLNNFDITQGGTYTVTVTQGTCSGTDNIVIDQIVPVAPNAGNPISQCTNNSINLAGTGSAGYTYLWTTADGNIVAGANTLAPTVSTTGTYVLTATSPEGCIDDDDVFVELLPQPVPNLGSNFQACPDLPFTVNLNNFADYTSVLWSDNSSGATYTGTAPSNGNVTVSVDVAINTCTASDQVTISAYAPPSWDLGAGATVCGDAPFTYTSTQNVLWQDGTLGNTYTQNNPVVGIETLTAVLTYGNNCIITDQADVNVLPPFVVDLPNTADFCEGGFVTIDAGNDVYWSTGEFGPSVNCNTVGTLIATYDDGYCYSQDAMEITMTYLPFIDWGDSTTYCLGQSVMLGTVGSHATSFSWSTGETSEFITVSEPGYYSLTASNTCGSAFRDVVLDFETCEAYAFIPNAFTPDQDGINEAWVPVLYNSKSYEVFIYNRWGDMIFHSTNPNENWLGETHKGEYYNQDGVYHYRMILESPNREKKEYYGVFHLLR